MEEKIYYSELRQYSQRESHSTTLSCLILGTPINNEPLLTQLIGRVIRKEEDKRDPVIVDIHLKGNTAKRQASTRMGHYMKQGYKIKEL